MRNNRMWKNLWNLEIQTKLPNISDSGYCKNKDYLRYCIYLLIVSYVIITLHNQKFRADSKNTTISMSILAWDVITWYTLSSVIRCKVMSSDVNNYITYMFFDLAQISWSLEFLLTKLEAFPPLFFGGNFDHLSITFWVVVGG